MNKDEIKGIIEALLFTWGDPLDIKDIASILDMDKKETEKILSEMIDDFKYNIRGLKIRKVKNTYQLGTRPEYHDYIKKLNKPQKTKSLSNAALETLSIIAYKQPVIKSDIEGIRGVKCDTAIYTLLDKDLIEERGRLDRIGRPILYGTTDNFLKVFGLESIKDLPELKKNLDLNNELKKEIEKLNSFEGESK